MKQEVIQDFLNLPGIEGLALMDGRSRPYFYGVDQGLNFKQKQALVQGIQQVVETTPVTYQFFQFQFGKHQIYVHKLAHGLILLVLATNKLDYATYQNKLAPLITELQRDVPSAIANFRLVTGQTNWGHRYQLPTIQPETVTHSLNSNTQLPIDPTTPPFSQNFNQSLSASAKNLAEPLTQPQDSSVPSLKSSFALPSSNQVVSPSLPLSTSLAQNVNDSASLVDQDITVDEFLHAINDLLHLSAEYLGRTMVSSYWKASRPPVEWLSSFTVNRLGYLEIVQDEYVQAMQILTLKQQQWLREWVTTFTKKCARIIRDFPQIALQMELDNRQKMLLFSTE
ncbi:MAG: hypothetical protein AAGD25_28385 [Cyanobacteria bacterium P01_F01_bin.150]